FEPTLDAVELGVSILDADPSLRRALEHLAERHRKTPHRAEDLCRLLLRLARKPRRRPARTEDAIDIGANVRQHVEVWSARSNRALDEHERAPDGDVLRGHSNPVAKHHAEERVEEVADADLLEPEPVVRVELLHELHGERRRVDLRCRPSLREDPTSETSVVLTHERDEELDQVVAHLDRQSADIADVDQADAPIRHEDDVPRMRVAVEHAMLEDLAEEARCETPCRLLPDVSRQAAPLERGELLTVEVLHGEDASRRELGVRPREADVLVIGGLTPEALEVVELVGEVELAPYRALEDAEDAFGIEEPHPGPTAQKIDQQAEDDEVLLDHALEAGLSHLDHDLVAAFRDRAVHLCDRRGGDRLLVDRCEELVRASAELDVEDASDLRERRRRHVVL